MVKQKLEISKDEKQLLVEIEKKKLERATKCLNEVNSVLKNHNCTLIVTPDVVINGQKMRVEVTAL